MNIKKLSLKNIPGKDWAFEPDFCYAEAHGSAELYETGDITLFRKEGDDGVTAVRFWSILKDDKGVFRVANN